MFVRALPFALPVFPLLLPKPVVAPNSLDLAVCVRTCDARIGIRIGLGPADPMTAVLSCTGSNPFLSAPPKTLSKLTTNSAEDTTLLQDAVIDVYRQFEDRGWNKVYLIESVRAARSLAELVKLPARVRK